MKLSTDFLVPSLLAIAVQLLAVSTASAEVRPLGECKNCTTQPYIIDPNCTVVSKVCERSFTVAVTPGVPTPITAGTFECKNCPSVNGHPCEPGTGPDLTCAVNITATIEVTASLDVTGTSGIEIGPFKDALEVAVGFSETHSVAVAVSGTYAVPFCKKAVLEGLFTQVKGSKAVATCTYLKKVTFSCPDGTSPVVTWNCAGGSAKLNFDSDPFGGGISVKSLDNCGG